MQGYNCIMVFSPDGKKLLFCKRMKNPYKGLYNLVGGKIEKDENGFEAAFRELREETGIASNKIRLYHMMDFTYYNQDCFVEVYVGQLREDTVLYEEAHPLEWLSVNENYFDSSRFAGEGNIGHMVEQVRLYGVGQEQPALQKLQGKAAGPGITGIGAVCENGEENNGNNDLLTNLDKIHTTELGAGRIKKNLGLDIADVAAWCRQKIESTDNIVRNGKNWYIYFDDFVITMNAHSFTIITAHIVKEM